MQSKTPIYPPNKFSRTIGLCSRSGLPSHPFSLHGQASYSMRQLHQKNIEKRLDSIEASMKSNHSVEHEEIRKIVTSGNVSTPSCIATAWTTLIIGYALGWRGGSWFSNRKFRREQLKLMGQMKPNRWRFLKRPFVRLRNTSIVKNATPEASPSTNAAASLPSNQIPSTS
ncbi:uncharacterized protein M6B38_336430 [Iris pallida]|uniref:Uncharacterized protein n=1 Tax=Iris pallida TaxID=29817 RepID=A0AAX6EIZ7_IRIPA|nr:uncharacterized protein M6B38_186595 [Iris pallida]KAJ6834255.1 uncharacterized protein M6B38_336430 [Iris pallida]